MPLYCYECSCGNTHEVFRPIQNRNKPVKCAKCPRMMKRAISAELVASTDQEYARPVLSDSAGCHPDQVPEMQKAARDAGIDLNYTKDGRAIFTSHAQRKRALKHLGMFDRDSYN